MTLPRPWAARPLTPRLALPHCGITKRGVIRWAWATCPLQAHKTQNTGATRELYLVFIVGIPLNLRWNHTIREASLGPLVGEGWAARV